MFFVSKFVKMVAIQETAPVSTTCVNDTGGKTTTGVNNTGGHMHLYQAFL
jgi:hypothetical protein